MDIVQYIKESCEHQNATTPENFIGMALAYGFIQEFDETFDDSIVSEIVIEILGAYVDSRNVNGYRLVPVVFANGNQGENPQNICRQIEHLIGYQELMDPKGFYQRFQEIHPFIDGNGRVGSLLFNYLNGTLPDPIHPPEIDWN